jgi:hypothetical protein
MMFAEAIEMAAQFTRPIHTITRIYDTTTVIPGAATLFFVNADGWALTCKHVAGQLTVADQLLQRFTSFKAERAQLSVGKKYRSRLHALEGKFGFSAGEPVEIYNRFVGCIEGPLEIEIRAHPSFDVALLSFKNFTRLCPSTFPVFAKKGEDLKQGKFLCRLGFPFPEFTNFEYDQTSEQIRWTNSGRDHTPQFPIEGMVTRHLLEESGDLTRIELSTPGLRGQSGGPAFDTEGRVWGMQSATNHLDLDFDVDVEVLRKGQKRHVKDSAFLHVGHCVHVDLLKQFMRDNNVSFQEG